MTLTRPRTSTFLPLEDHEVARLARRTRGVQRPDCASCRAGETAAWKAWKDGAVADGTPEPPRSPSRHPMTPGSHGWSCDRCGAFEPYTDSTIRSARRYHREHQNQLGAILLTAIDEDVNRTANRLDVDPLDAREIVGRVLDMIEGGAARIGHACPECHTVIPFVDSGIGVGGGNVECPEHGYIARPMLALVVPSASSVKPPPL